METNSTVDGEAKQKLNQKLEYEILRLKAETNKLDAETKQIKHKEKIVTKTNILKAIFAVILIGPIIWFYFHEIFLPVAQKENIELGLQIAKGRKEVKEAEEKLELQKSEHNKEVEQLRKNQELVELKLSKLEDIREKLSNENRSLQHEYENLSQELTQSEVVKEDMKLKLSQLSLKLEKNNKMLLLLKKFYDEYWKIKHNTYLYIDPEFIYEGKTVLNQLQEKIIKQVPSLFKGSFKMDFSKVVTMLEKEKEYLVADDILRELTEEEKKAFYHEADYKVEGAILDFNGNHVLTRFELLKVKDEKEVALISFLYNLLTDSNNPVEVFESYNLARDRILKAIYQDKLAGY